VLRGRSTLYVWSSAAVSVALVVGARPWFLRFALVVAGTACCAAAVRRADVKVSVVVCAITVVTAAAVLSSPRESHDLWSYVEYGRMLAVHGVSPYLHTPSQFPHDPFFRLVDWRQTPSVYGPVFNEFAALG
jgi:hypothetical protein